jgi:hypothetical protein
MTRKQFLKLVSKKTDPYMIGEMERAWSEYRSMLRMDSKMDGGGMLGLASAFFCFGWYGVIRVDAVLPNYGVLHFLVSLSFLLFMARRQLIWELKQEAEFRLHNPRAWYLF